MLRTIFNFGVTIAVLTAISLVVGRYMGKHYDHDPQCVRNEGVYKHKPCIKTGEWFP